MSRSQVIENKTVDYVPESERHGQARSLFTLWFCTNIAPLAVVTGAISTQTFHLNVLSAISAIVAGHMFGGLFLALTSAQGPRVGIPQMVQSRAQFGRYGSLLVVVFTTVIYLGFFISNVTLSGKVINNVLPAIPLTGATVVGAIAATLIGVVGYRFIHRINKIGAWVMGSALVLGLGIMLLQPLPAAFWHQGTFSLSGWFATFCICAVWQMSFSPYTSDYSRYLPANIGVFKPFICTWLGACCGTILAFLVGVVAINVVGGEGDAMAAVRQATGWLGPILMVLFLLNIICHNSMNLYGSVLSLITAVQTFRPDWRPDARVRVVVSAIVLVGGVLVSAVAAANFVAFFLNLIWALIGVLIPWCVINLLDFYVVNRQRYDISAIFSADGGRYGLVNTRALAIYFGGVLVQVPFVENTFFTGPWAHLIPGADISWMISLVVTSAAYLYFYRRDTSLHAMRGKDHLFFGES
ncbi:purine-cytosine permease family protein [Serratia ficaria]|uniref:purine-cytosine permease family protein n=1 Tax=Serratia ficaria TaxID=61651 RepID=UPI0021783D04|nr:cytosine permease [Serratia ficaria]CAI0721948.1 NCS1 nucleoside transporter family [Serratia ficaria]CAI1161625.1 NCS1 nucleoside transporter family [Serratia ficaria]CAI1582922.1 NCS1 nucleoside transporter family [Serratia ficaria]CAI1599259.1 NCS1 nucleoside transporter family [Serratia ficaria]CAI1715019.1 NCS1 nucleoside transporter family [Serratia ficaria]